MSAGRTIQTSLVKSSLVVNKRLNGRTEQRNNLIGVRRTNGWRLQRDPNRQKADDVRSNECRSRGCLLAPDQCGQLQHEVFVQPGCDDWRGRWTGCRTQQKLERISAFLYSLRPGALVAQRSLQVGDQVLDILDPC
jgi:hypothetical protein